MSHRVCHHPDFGRRAACLLGACHSERAVLRDDEEVVDAEAESEKGENLDRLQILISIRYQLRNQSSIRYFLVEMMLVQKEGYFQPILNE